ncbi:MAG: hypothetical protein PHT07_03110 [Paludibacter sp.]|nr:hypothetical protein [Paludibacter sp.]
MSQTDTVNAKESVTRVTVSIKNWLRNRHSLEFRSTWEMIHNPNFKVVEFDCFKSQAGISSAP